MASQLSNGTQRPGMGSRRRGNDGMGTLLAKTEGRRHPTKDHTGGMNGLAIVEWNAAAGDGFPPSRE